jgi:hypothetical protein
MSKEPAPSFDLDGLVDEACECLDQYRKMDMSDRAIKAAPLRCGLDAVPNFGGRIHQ